MRAHLSGREVARPVRSISVAQPINEIATSKRANLIVGYIEYSSQLTDPVCCYISCLAEGSTSIADKNCHVALYDAFDAVIIVDPSISQYHLFAQAGRS